MSRPFSQTMQAHELDLHRLWLVLLLLASLLVVVWVGWASTDSIVVYENGSSIQVTERVSASQTLEQQGNIYRTRTWRQRWLQASFPDTARGKLQPGQPAVIFLAGAADQPGIAAVLTEVLEEGEPGMVGVMLRADIPEEAADPFSHALPERVKVAVGTTAPITLLLSGRPPAGPAQLRP